MSLPTARVIRQAGVAVSPPPASLAQRLVALDARVGGRGRSLLAAVVGLWPVTAVVLLAVSLTWMAALGGSP